MRADSSTGGCAARSSPSTSSPPSARQPGPTRTGCSRMPFLAALGMTDAPSYRSVLPADPPPGFSPLDEPWLPLDEPGPEPVPVDELPNVPELLPMLVPSLEPEPPVMPEPLEPEAPDRLPAATGSPLDPLASDAEPPGRPDSLAPPLSSRPAVIVQVVIRPAIAPMPASY